MYNQHEWPYRFNELTVSPVGDGVRTATLQFGRAAIEFRLEPDTGKSKTTFPLIKIGMNEQRLCIGARKGSPNTERQKLFELLVTCLAHLHPAKCVPNTFEDSAGNRFSLDLATASWVVESESFDRICDAEGRHYIKPRI